MTTNDQSKPQVALIVGGGPGISASCARLFCANGMRVAIAARRPDKPELVSLAADYDVTNYRCDASDPESVGKLFGTVQVDLGTPTLVVHNIDGRMRDIFRKGVAEADPALVHEVLPARGEKGADNPESKPHRHMRGGVADLGHGCHHQQRLRGDHPDDHHQERADGDLKPDEVEGPFDIEHHRALGALGSFGRDDQVEQGQQSREADPLRQCCHRDRQHHHRAARRIGRIEVAEELGELADAVGGNQDDCFRSM